jgi:hypothetical protein
MRNSVQLRNVLRLLMAWRTQRDLPIRAAYAQLLSQLRGKPCHPYKAPFDVRLPAKVEYPHDYP